MKSAELVVLAAKKQGVSVYKIGKMLGFNDSSRIYDIKSGRQPLAEKDVCKVCEWADVDPIIVFPELLAERASKPEQRKIWERIATLVKQSGATAAALLLAVSLSFMPVPAEASLNNDNNNIIHYAQLVRLYRRRYISVKNKIIAIIRSLSFNTLVIQQ